MARAAKTLNPNAPLTTREENVLRVFREFLMRPGQMLCFHGPDLDRHRESLETLTDRDLLVSESFKGGYSLTTEGFEAMKACTSRPAPR
ncbi:hypothetical protein FF011L_25270 [Roseimaritima multifibrata]|uniref:Uncharacterized protein n=1 Tax=Roseimaritima multifibrata TaxID=1930274 RepID=A0A517MFT6_9BACT|nr:hypothetical protein [Roseimaritima multifibrata]QDS93754.1 hypothetical protein FF011L_25270 [Roseimaritima multifibrata]